MARKKDLGKPSVLSQEYVVDSDSDGLGEAGASAQKTTSISEWERPMKRKQKKAQTASNIGTKSTSGRRNDVKETSSPISHESSSEGERSSQREVEKTQKRQKTMPPT